MKLRIETYGKKYTIETENEDLTIDEYIEQLTSLLVCAGFARETIIECFNEME